MLYSLFTTQFPTGAEYISKLKKNPSSIIHQTQETLD